MKNHTYNRTITRSNYAKMQAPSSNEYHQINTLYSFHLTLSEMKRIYRGSESPKQDITYHIKYHKVTRLLGKLQVVWSSVSSTYVCAWLSHGDKTS